ncbi:MAG TPA: hypothetical protein VF475_06480 [Sphingobium sp.]
MLRIVIVPPMQAAITDMERNELGLLAEQVRRSGVLGRSAPMRSLFDYLVTTSMAGHAPKEQQIASEVFGRDPDFDPVQDAVVRVYVHKLRKCLTNASADTGAGATRIVLPRGQYRLLLSDAGEEGREAAVPAPVRSHRWRLAVAALLIAALSVTATWAWMRPPAQERAIEAVRAQAPWAGLLGNGLPTVIVLGDYYLVGESDDGEEVARLVREFDINSGLDLETNLLDHPERMGRYIDMDLRYLPTGAGSALARLMPVIGQGSDDRRVSVVLASGLTPEMIKSSNIVYVGYFSGLRSLAPRLFARSRFGIGASFDEIVDHHTHRRYVSQAAVLSGDGENYADYGLLSVFPGPGRNRIVVMAGMRDTALQQISDLATRGDRLRDLAGRVKDADAFEALYEVAGMRNTDVGSKLLVAARVDAAGLWAAP